MDSLITAVPFSRFELAASRTFSTASPMLIVISEVFCTSPAMAVAPLARSDTAWLISAVALWLSEILSLASVALLSTICALPMIFLSAS